MFAAEGSSPLTRGKHEAGMLALARLGLIPAHAGKTLSADAQVSNDQAHPRSRGENTHTACARTIIEGSSPLTRGKPGALDMYEDTRGLIPAHAGKTEPLTGGGVLAGAHPRSRGENW